MRVAVTVWQQRVSPVFDVARCLQLLEIEQGQVVADLLVPLSSHAPLEKLQAIQVLQPDILICGAISQPIQQVAESLSFQLYPFMKGSIRRVMRALIHEGVLAEDFVLPGCQHRLREMAVPQPGSCRCDGNRESEPCCQSVTGAQQANSD